MTTTMNMTFSESGKKSSSADLPGRHTNLSDIDRIKRADDGLFGFGRILEDSLNEIYIFDAESLRFLIVNRGARNNLGYTMTELHGLTPLDLKLEFTSGSFDELIRPLRTGERSLIEFETTHRRKDGSDYPVEVHLQLSMFEGQAAYVAIILDITRRRRAEIELEKAIKNARDGLEKQVQERTDELETANRLLITATEDLKSEKQILQRLNELQEEDRRMVAHDVHDGFLQYVQAAHMHVQAIKGAADPDTIDSMANLIEGLLQKALAEGRRMILGLQPLILDDEGIVEAIQHLIAFEQAHADLTVDFQHDVQIGRLESSLEGVIFRIVQESLHNVVRHGQTDHATVQFTQHNDMLEVVVQDQGVGFDPEKVPRERFGLRGICERATLSGGTAKIESAPGEGTIIRVLLPVQLGT